MPRISRLSQRAPVNRQGDIADQAGRLVQGQLGSLSRNLHLCIPHLELAPPAD